MEVSGCTIECALVPGETLLGMTLFAGGFGLIFSTLVRFHFVLFLCLLKTANILTLRMLAGDVPLSILLRAGNWSSCQHQSSCRNDFSPLFHFWLARNAGRPKRRAVDQKRLHYHDGLPDVVVYDQHGRLAASSRSAKDCQGLQDSCELIRCCHGHDPGA